jgi:hypothetical protein
LLSQPASWPPSTLVNISNWTPPTAGSWQSHGHYRSCCCC